MAEVKRRRRAHGYTTYKRKDGRWGWAVTIGVNAKGNPQRVQGVCKTETLAQTAAIEVLGKHRQGLEPQTGRDKTVEVYLNEWLELYIRPHREPKTVKYYEGMIKHHLAPAIGRIGLRKLTAANVQKMLNDSAKPFTIKVKKKDEDGKFIEVEVVKKRSAETIRGIRATLRSGLGQAYKDGLIAQNPATRVNTPKGERKDRDYLKPDEINTLFERAKGHPLERLILVALLTGMRVGELTGLTWENVDLDAKTLKVRAQLQRIEGTLQLKRLKSDNANRTLYIAPTAETAFKDQRAEQMIQKATMIDKGEYNPLNLVFLNPEGRPLDPKYIDKHLKALLASAGIRSMSFHKLRHTAATLSLASGAPISTVKDQLGHSQIALTVNTYGHAVSGAMKSVAESLERAIGKG